MLSIVIPSIGNRETQLRGLLEELVAELRTIDDASEVLVGFDGCQGSSDAVTWMRELAIVVHAFETQRGPGAVRNDLVARSGGDWILFLDDDVLPSKQLVHEYLSAISRFPDCQIFEGAVHSLGERSSILDGCPENVFGGRLWSCNFCIRRDVFEAIGGFDEQYRSACMEDVDLYRRLCALGLEVRFLPQAVVYHPWSRRYSLHHLRAEIVSVRGYLQKFPEERGRLNWFYYLRRAGRALFDQAGGRMELLPRLWRVGYEVAVAIGICASVA